MAQSQSVAHYAANERKATKPAERKTQHHKQAQHPSQHDHMGGGLFLGGILAGGHGGQNILVVEDDYDLNQAICYSLKKSGYGVYGVTFMEKGKKIFIENQIDMVLLDVNLPDGEGFSFCQWVKKQREVPVIYLTARDMEEDALAGYESGAEDYVTKPFSMKILLRKIEVILKRTASVNRLIFADEYLYIDLDNARVTVKGQECPVTPTECRLLRQFLMNRGQLLTYDLLLERLWDSGGQFVDKHTLAVNVNRLRGKIEDKNHRYISNVYGMGYQWIG